MGDSRISEVIRVAENTINMLRLENEHLRSQIALLSSCKQAVLVNSPVSVPENTPKTVSAVTDSERAEFLDKIQKLTECLEERETRITELTAEAKDSLNLLDEANKEKKSLSRANTHLENELKSYKEMDSTKRIQESGVYKSLVKTYADTQNSYNELKSQKDASDKYIRELEEKVRTLEEEKQTPNNKKKNPELEKLRSDYDKKVNECRKARKELDAKEKEIAELRKRLEEFEKKANAEVMASVTQPVEETAEEKTEDTAVESSFTMEDVEFLKDAIEAEIAEVEEQYRGLEQQKKELRFGRDKKYNKDKKTFKALLSKDDRRKAAEIDRELFEMEKYLDKLHKIENSITFVKGNKSGAYSGVSMNKAGLELYARLRAKHSAKETAESVKAEDADTPDPEPAEDNVSNALYEPMTLDNDQKFKVVPIVVSTLMVTDEILERAYKNGSPETITAKGKGVLVAAMEFMQEMADTIKQRNDIKRKYEVGVMESESETLIGDMQKHLDLIYNGQTIDAFSYLLATLLDKSGFAKDIQMFTEPRKPLEATVIESVALKDEPSVLHLFMNPPTYSLSCLHK